MPTATGHVFWIFGLSGAGKSTLADILVENLRRTGITPLALDGDILRSGLCRGVGFSEADRTENLRRAAEVARLGANSGLCVVASFITPLADHRRQVCDIVGANRVSLILADSPLAVCSQRDTKGLYAQANAGQMTNLTGISAKFEVPTVADLTVRTFGISAAESGVLLVDFCREKLGLTAEEKCPSYKTSLDTSCNFRTLIP